MWDRVALDLTYVTIVWTFYVVFSHRAGIVSDSCCDSEPYDSLGVFFYYRALINILCPSYDAEACFERLHQVKGPRQDSNKRT